MRDGFGREIDYLRISITDKCNLRCKYCMPEYGVDFVEHAEILSLEEIYRIVRITEPLGIKKLRFTGGEPLVRKNLVKLIADVNSLKGIEDIAITTNGVLLKENINSLKSAGLKRVNISLDTLDREIFKNITGYDGFVSVLEAVDEAYLSGMKVKINCVPCRELNGESFEGLAELARERSIDVRFIELMPIGCGKNFSAVPSAEILARLEKIYGACKKEASGKDGETAKYYMFDGFKGRVGFISPISHKFCSACNRVRLTAEGRLKLCLHYDDGVDLKPLLRSGKSDEEIRERIEKAIKNKPKAHSFSDNSIGGVVSGNEDKRKMVQIGG